MDLWVVAAAAGAGYLGKHLQNLSRSEKEKLLESFSKVSSLKQSEPMNFLQQIREKTCPLRRLARKGALGEAASDQNDFLDHFGNDSVSIFGRAAKENIRRVEDMSLLRLSTPAPGSSERDTCLHSTEFMDYSSPSFARLRRYKLLRSKSSGHVLELLDSLEDNLPKVSEYVHSTLPIPLAPIEGQNSVSDGDRIMRRHNGHSLIPLAPIGGQNSVSDGDRIMRRHNGHSLDSLSSLMEDNLRNDAIMSGPSLSDTESVDQLLHRDNRNSFQEKALDGTVQSSELASGMLLFLIGLTIGIAPEVFSYTREVKELNEKLKQAENLVQDLQEELDMKDKLTVKELPKELSQPLSTKHPSPFNEEPTVSGFGPCDNDISSYDSKLADNQKEEDLQSMSRIEAELEAELEMLGINMDLERTSDFQELDAQYEVDTIQGDLKLDALKRHYENASESESDEENGTIEGPTPPANYAVSPRELSIRLHELIQSRLEARIKELENALHNNQNEFHSLESQCFTSPDSAYSDGESSTTPESPHQLSQNVVDASVEAKGRIAK